MKLLVAFGLILICCSVSATKSKISNYEDMLVTFLKKFKTTLKTGDEKLGIPVLDPFNSDRLAIDVKEDVVSINANLTNVNANGLSEYDILPGNNLAISLTSGINITVNLSWPLVTASTNYALKGKFQDFELYGNGEMDLSAYEFAFETKIFCILDGGLNGHLKINKMILNLALKALDFKATGIFDDDELSKIISAVVSDMAPRLVSDGKIVDEIKKLIRQQLDAFLASKTLLEIIKLIT